MKMNPSTTVFKLFSIIRITFEFCKSEYYVTKKIRLLQHNYYVARLS